MSVSEDEISASIALFVRHHHKVIEGAAAVAIAAALKDGGRKDPSAPIAIIACGANISSESLLSVLGDEKV